MERIPPTHGAALVSTDSVSGFSENPYQRIPSERVELSRLSAHASEACVSTSSTKRARCRRAKPRDTIARHRIKRGKQVRHTLLSANFFRVTASSMLANRLREGLSVPFSSGHSQGSGFCSAFQGCNALYRILRIASFFLHFHNRPLQGAGRGMYSHARYHRTCVVLF